MMRARQSTIILGNCISKPDARAGELSAGQQGARPVARRHQDMNEVATLASESEEW